MAALLALFSALGYGSGDFLGGLAARRIPPAAVVLRSNAFGLALLAAALPLLPAAHATPGDLMLGAVGGAIGGGGVLLMYRGMRAGAMSVVAPITAVMSAVVPVVVGLADGERPAPIALLGIPLGVFAIALLTQEERSEIARRPRGLRVHAITALLAGTMFGLFFVALAKTGDHAGIWPVVAGRTASTAMFFLVALASRSARPARGVAWSGTTPALLSGCGALDAVANVLFLVATQHGMLTLVAVLGALYPLPTVLLARAFLGERLGGPQRIGVLIAATAVVLVTLG